MSSPEPSSFTGLVQAALDAALTPEIVQAKVDEQVGKIIDSVIKDSFSTWNGAGKTVQAAVTKALEVGDGLNIPSYGNVVCEILSAQIQARVSEVVGAKLQEDMEKLLKLAPKEVSLSRLIEDLLGQDDGVDGVSLTVEWGEYSSAWVYISEGHDRPAHLHEHDIQLLFRLPKKADEHERGEPIKGTISCGTVKGSDLSKDVQFGWGADYRRKPRQFGNWFSFEQKILSMYALGTVIELDEDNCVLSRWED